MNRLTLTARLPARLFAAAAAATVTLSLFGGVVSIAEPQQSALLAKIHQYDATRPEVRMASSAHRDAAPAIVAVAMNDSAKIRR